MIEFIITYASMWAPALTALLGIVIGVVTGLTKIAEAINNAKQATAELRQTDDFKKLHDDLRQAHMDNVELKKMNNELLDLITHVKNYSDFKNSKE